MKNSIEPTRQLLPHTPLAATHLPDGIRARIIPGINGLDMHVLEAGFETGDNTSANQPRRPLLLLLHGFPELAYSWRKLMLPLAAAGYHVVAPDQRGYGRTRASASIATTATTQTSGVAADAPWEIPYDTDLRPFSLPNLVRDALGLVWALGHTQTQAVIGHDFGSPVAAWCAVIRPDVFQRVVMMSSPFAGTPSAPLPPAQTTAQATAHATPQPAAQTVPPPINIPAVLDELSRLPRPRKHYQWYYSTPEANADMQHCAQGVHAFMRAYYHVKSADWKANQPHRLAAWSAGEMAKLPTYYMMDLHQDMATTVAPEMPSAAAIADCAWLPDHELAVYAAEYSRTGYQGGLQWYRTGTTGQFTSDLQTWAGRTIDIPSLYIAGKSDWGVYQKPGDFEAMQTRHCTRFMGAHLVEGAGHWVQQEQPEKTAALLLDFLRKTA
jgi:pimeloyl-ACP methyl ester carboxylesterase